MILVPPHILIVRCIALWVKSTSHRASREEWRFYVHMYTIYYTHLSSWMCSSQQEGGVCSQTKFSSHPQKKGQVQRSASFWNCVIYAWHTLNMILSLYSKDSSSSSFLFTEIPGSSSWNSAQKFISFVISHLVPPKNDQSWD